MNIALIFSAAVLMLVGCGSSDQYYKSKESRAGLFEWGVENVPELLPPGPGAGEWNSEPARLDNVALARSAKTYLATSDARNRYGVEAAGTFLQYFENNGEDYPVDLSKLLADVPRVKALYDELLAQLKSEAVTQSEGKRLFTLKDAKVSTVDRAESENWYLAVAGFSYWISGDVDIDAEGQISGRVTLGFWDRYDWDPGVVIPIPTPFGQINVDQDRVGEFHRQGLAKEYDTIGSLDLTIR
jgi:hypothetical protein